MTKNLICWYRISIIDSEGLPGKSIADVIQCLQKCIDFKFVVIDHIVGARISALLEKENAILEIKDLLEIIFEIAQFDWGDFFLFKEYPKKWDNSKNVSYPDVIKQTDTTIRAIDDTYIYVYTPYQEIVDILKKNYEIESLMTDSIDKLDYPY